MALPMKYLRLLTYQVDCYQTPFYSFSSSETLPFVLTQWLKSKSNNHKWGVHSIIIMSYCTSVGCLGNSRGIDSHLFSLEDISHFTQTEHYHIELTIKCWISLENICIEVGEPYMLNAKAQLVGIPISRVRMPQKKVHSKEIKANGLKRWISSVCTKILCPHDHGTVVPFYVCIRRR